MSESNGNPRKSYVYHPNYIFNHTCLTHSPGHSSDECKVLGDFGSKYSIIMHAEDRGHDPITKNKFNRQQQNNDIVNHALAYIILKDNNTLSAAAEAHENIDSKIDENDLYQIDNMSLY